MTWVTLRDGNHLHVRVIGRGQPVVLLHGFASQSMHWLPNILPLAYRFKFILPDFRGFGKSCHVKITQENVFEQYAHDLHDVLNHFDIKKTALGGISTGAYTCLVYNQLYGFNRVSRYLNIEHSPEALNHDDWQGGLFSQKQDELFDVFRELSNMADKVGPYTPYKTLPMEARKAFSLTLARVLSRAINTSGVRNVTRQAGLHAEPLLAGPVFPVANWYAYIQVMRSFMHGHDTRSHLDTIKAPTTLMIGGQSRFFNIEGQLEIKKYVPQAKVVIFEKSGHIPILDEPLRFQRQFSRFLTER